jgi:hypothetical protein
VTGREDERLARQTRRAGAASRNQPGEVRRWRGGLDRIGALATCEHLEAAMHLLRGLVVEGAFREFLAGRRSITRFDVPQGQWSGESRTEGER